MPAPITAEVVNAFLQPALELIRRCVQGDTALERLELTNQLPRPPLITVTMHIRGQLVGPVHWSFEQPVALKLAGAMTGLGRPPDLSSPECADAIGELANIITGNATGALLEAGYAVEVSLPRTQVARAPAHLAEKLPNLVLTTPLGKVRIVFGLRVA
jgi:CheY-specific phosphatase CheX